MLLNTALVWVYCFGLTSECDKGLNLPPFTSVANEANSKVNQAQNNPFCQSSAWRYIKAHLVYSTLLGSKGSINLVIKHDK